MVVCEACDARFCSAARQSYFRIRRVPRIKLMRQNTNQPKREFLENGENQEIRKIRNNKQKCQKPELQKDPAKRKESQKNKIREQNCASESKSKTKPNQKRCEEVASHSLFGEMRSAMRARHGKRQMKKLLAVWIGLHVW